MNSILSRSRSRSRSRLFDGNGRERKRERKRECVLLAAFLLFPAMLRAQQDSTRIQRDSSVSISFGGFVDTYFAAVTANPELRDIFFLTQPGRDREFNINLTYLDAKLSG